MMKLPEKYNKNDCNFDEWWDYTVMVYGKGWLAAPAIGFDPEAYERGEYKVYVPSLDEVEVFIEHLRSFDTHESISIAPGIYEIRRQREYTPEGWKRVED